jgi:4'-phosphopantetheinyl transferase
MALIRNEDLSEYRIGVWKIEESETLLVQLSGIEVPSKIHNESRRLEYLAVRATAKELGINPSCIAYQRNGKPYIPDSDLQISISHTKGYAALLISTIPFVGVDIEHHSSRVLKIRKKFMHPAEEQRLQILQLTEKEELLAILLHWCAKEALFKATPDEGLDFALELRIESFDQPKTKGHFKGTALRSNQSFQVDYHMDSNYVLTCCFSTESK